MPPASPHRRAPVILPARRPMASARRVSLFEREIRVGLSSAALDILFEAAAVLSEGDLEEDRFFGSTMITIDLSRTAHLVSDACDLATARRIATLFGTDERARERARAVCVAEAEARAGCRLRAPRLDVRVRSTGRHLHLDVDIDAEPERTP